MRPILPFVPLILLLLVQNVAGGHQTGKRSETIVGRLARVRWTANIYKDKAKESLVLSEVTAGTYLAITGESDGWYGVLMANGSTGRIAKGNINLLDYEVTRAKGSQRPPSTASTRSSLESQRAKRDMLKRLAESQAALEAALARVKREDSLRKSLAVTDPVYTPRYGRSKIYIGTGSGHWIDHVSSGGKIVELEDGSVWEISPLDRIDTSLWLPVSDITVTDGDDPGYPYLLINKDDGETANAKLLSHR